MESNVKNVAYASIHWFMEENSRNTSFGNPTSDLTWKTEIDGAEEKVTGTGSGTEKDGLVYNLRNGWDVSQGVCKVRAATKAQASAAVEDRERQIKEWERQPEKSVFAVIARELWFPDGKPVSVEYIANECYRRSRGVLGVLVRRAMDTQYGVTGKYSLDYNIPIVVVQFASERERMLSHYAENGLKDAGRMPYSEVDIFFIAKNLLALDPGRAKESDLVKTGVAKRGQAIKCFGLALLDRAHPELKIGERLLLGSKRRDKDEMFVYSKDGPLFMNRIKHDRIQKLKAGFAYNETKTEDKYKIRGGVKAKHVEDYFRDVLQGMEAARTVMLTKEITTAMSTSPLQLFKWLAAEINAGNRDCFAYVEKHASKINNALAFLPLDVAESDETESESESEAKTTTKTKTVAAK